MRFAVSTCAFRGKDIDEIIDRVNRLHLTLEFSSGLPFRPEMEDIFVNAPIERLPHNYFPAPQIPFVLNLASANHEIRYRSINFCIQGLHLAKQANSPFYSAHAGFCLDPDPERLGKPLATKSVHSKEHHWKLFIDSLHTILESAEALGTGFLIENNVIARFNLLSNGENPLLCCSAEDILMLFEEMRSDKFGFLLDTAHLKISAHTLSLSAEDSVKQIEPFIKAIHHSDNDGFSDTNAAIGHTYWFLPFMNRFSQILHVLEVNDQSEMQIIKQKEILENAINKT